MFTKSDNDIEDDEELLKELENDGNDGGQYEYNKENRPIDDSDEKYNEQNKEVLYSKSHNEYEEHKELFA